MMDNERPDASDARFEERLRSVTPAAPTDALRDGIARRVASRRVVGPWAIGLAGLATAACIAMGVWVSLSWPTHGTPPELVEDNAPAPPAQTPTPDAAPGTDPADETTAPAGSLLAYHHALRHSPDAVLTALEPPTPPTAHAAPGNARPLRAMDAAMFLHEDERCDG